MTFPAVTSTSDGDISAAFVSAAQAAGIKVTNLSGLSQLQLVAANLLQAFPATVTVPASQVSAGTFGAGDYTFTAPSGNVLTVDFSGAAGTRGLFVLQRGDVTRGFVGTDASDNLVLYDAAIAAKFSWSSTGIGFYTTAPVAKQTVTGSKGANAALTSLMSALSTLGLVTDSTT